MTEPANEPGQVLVKAGPVAELTLSRPGRANALDWRMGEAMARAVARLKADASVRVVVMRGAGRHFCAGGDFGFIESNTQLPRAEVEQRMLRFYRFYLSVLELQVPTVALMQGSAIGAGLCLALACDFRLAAADAKLGLNFVRIGLHPGMGATLLTPRACGRGNAAELLLTGKTVDGLEAQRLRLVSRAVDAQQLEAEGQRLAQQIARAAPLAVRQTLASIARPTRDELNSALEREASCQADNFAGSEVPLAIAAFHNKQAPDFSNG